MARRRGDTADDGGAREASPLMMEEIEFEPRRRYDRGKRKAVASDSKNSKRAKAEGRFDTKLCKRTGGIVFRSPIHKDGADLTAEEHGDLGQGTIVAGESSVHRVGDVGSEFFYVGRTGKKCMVKRSDCSFHSAPIATCLLEGIVLDGDKAELEDEDMGTILGTMDMACCLFLAGYDKLKDTVQRTDNGESDKVELVRMWTAWETDKKKLKAMMKKHQDVTDERSVLVSSMIDLQEKLAVVIEYAKHCQGVARKAQGVYDRVCGEYAMLEENYLQLSEECERGSLGTSVLVIPRDVRNAPSTSVAPVVG